MGRPVPKGKPAGKPPGPKKGGYKGKARAVDEDLDISDSEEELDAFKSRKDRVNLNASDDGDTDSDGVNEEGVYDLSDHSSDDDDDEDEEFDEDDDIEDALQQGGTIAQRKSAANRAQKGASVWARVLFLLVHAQMTSVYGTYLVGYSILQN